MRPLSLFLIVVALVASPLGAQRRQLDTVVGVDVDLLGGSLTYARALGPSRYWGLDAGLGGAFLHRMLYAGSHFAAEEGASYQDRDGAVGRALVELVHAGVFIRWVPSDWLTADLGPRGSVLLHFDSSHESPAVPLFAGLYGAVMVGSRSLKIGPRVMAGVFAEGSSIREFGVYLVPVSARLSFGW